jgi:hypothetical protein
MKRLLKFAGIVILCLAVGFVAGGILAGRNMNHFMRNLASAEMIAAMDRMAVYHDGRTERAAESWEQAIDGYISSMHQSMQADKRARSDPRLIEAMQVAKAYRAQYPPTPMMRSSVEEALASVEPMTGVAPMLQVQCDAALLQILRDYAAGATARQTR